MSSCSAGVGTPPCVEKVSKPARLLLDRVRPVPNRRITLDPPCGYHPGLISACEVVYDMIMDYVGTPSP